MLEKIEPMEFIEDDEIIRLFHERKREQEAFRLLVNKYKERLYWHIRKIVINHDDTDDLLQNVFVKIWQGLQEFRNDSKLYTWMYRIATNESLNFLNEKSRKVYGNSDEISVYLENTLESDTYFSGDKIQKELQRAILTLSERQRLIFNMKYFDDMPYEDMADVLGVAVGTLKATYHNAVKKNRRKSQNRGYLKLIKRWKILTINIKTERSEKKFFSSRVEALYGLSGYFLSCFNGGSDSISRSEEY